jgi:hypothetical protein
MNKTKNIQRYQIQWILIGCVPLFFFVRGIHLILTGGGWIATAEQPVHWVLLFLEIFIATFAILGCFFLWYKKSFVLNKEFLNKTILIKAITICILFTFIIHFIRVGFWIQNSVL